MTQFLKREGFSDLAYNKTGAVAGNILPTILFCAGFRSDMEGTKAIYLEAQCAARGQGFVRFDYSGHGVSGGVFEEGSIGDWLADTLTVIDEVIEGDVIIVGSSMGGWIGLLAAQARPERVKGFLGIAAAPDFTREVYAAFDDAQRIAYDAQGFVDLPSDYDAPYRFTKKLIEDGEQHCLLDGALDIHVPVRLIQGKKDDAVPWKKATRIKEILPHSAQAEILFVEDGDHRLSEPSELLLIEGLVQDLNGLYRKG